MTRLDADPRPTASRFFPKAPPDGLIAAALLAFLATAGLFYVNIMAAIVDGLITGDGLSPSQAGNIGSANIYGAAAGALMAVFIVRHVGWRPAAISLLLGLITIDLTSIFIHSADVLIVVRFFHGLVGGTLVGTAFAVIARTRSPDRTFGMLLFIQYGLGGVGVMTLPRLVPIFGTQALFLALAAFSLMTLAMVPFLADYPPRRIVKPVAKARVNRWPLILTLSAIFLFQAANMALLAYNIRLGLDYGLDRGYVSTALGAATWIALIGPVLAMVFSVRAGRFRLLVAAMVATLLGTALFHWSGHPVAYLVANSGTGATWAFVIAYLLGMTAEFDRSGRTAALGGFISKMGLASGPLAAGFLLQAGAGFGTLINVSLVSLALSMALMLIPARLLDRARAVARETGAAEPAE